MVGQPLEAGDEGMGHGAAALRAITLRARAPLADTYSYFYDFPGDTWSNDDAWERALIHCGDSDADVEYIRALVAEAVAAYNIGTIVALAGAGGGAARERRTPLEAVAGGGGGARRAGEA